MTGTKRADKVTRKDRGCEWYKNEGKNNNNKKEAHNMEDCGKGQEAKGIFDLRFEFM